MTNPKDCTCHTHPPAKPKAVELAKLEAILADCRARKAKAKTGTPMPLIACLATATATAELKAKPGTHRQASAELDRLKAENATLKARLASAPAKPAAPATLTATARREAAKAASTLSGATADKFSDSMLFQAATHRSSPESDKAIAKAELEKRGFSISPEGILSQSFRK